MSALNGPASPHGLVPDEAGGDIAVSADLLDARPRWPALSRRLMATAGIFAAGFLVVALLVQLRRFDRLDFRLLHYLQDRGSFGQDIALGTLRYAGSIEVTLVLAALLAFPLFRGLRLLALGPTLALLIGSGLEYVGKHVITNAPPDSVYDRIPDFLPALSRHIAPNSFPSGHMLRATLLYGLIVYLAERWQLFGKDSSRLSPVLILLVILLGYALMYTGSHWFSDVVGGALLGLALLTAMIAYLERKRLVLP